MTPPGPEGRTGDDVRSRVDSALRAHLAGLARELAPLSDELDPLLQALTSMVSGGKRVRAGLAYWSWRAHGGRPGTPQDEAAVRLGAGLELFQAAALFHDDVMDSSDTRRALPAAHRVFASRHRSAGLRGDPDRFGESSAILLGDLALVASEREVTSAVAGLSRRRRVGVLAVFDLMRTEVTAGQYLDLLAQAQPWGDDPAQDEARARAVIRAKSARYSVEHPLVLGAALAGAAPERLDLCRQVGLPLGEAFQLRDDLLGVFGDPATTGKPAGDDLREGKRTVLVARAAALADAPTRRLLAERLGDRTMDATTTQQLAHAISASGAVEQVEDLISSLAEPALALLAAQPFPALPRQRLLELAHAVVDRRA